MLNRRGSTLSRYGEDVLEFEADKAIVRQIDGENYGALVAALGWCKDPVSNICLSKSNFECGLTAGSELVQSHA